MIHDDNAVTAVAEAAARLGRHHFPIVMTDAVEQFLAAVAEETGYSFDWSSRISTGRWASWERLPGSSAPPFVILPTRPC